MDSSGCWKFLDLIKTSSVEFKIIILLLAPLYIESEDLGYRLERVLFLS